MKNPLKLEEKRKRLFDTDRWHFNFLEGVYRYICAPRGKYHEISLLLGEEDFIVYGRERLSIILEASNPEKVDKLIEILEYIEMNEEVSILEARFPKEVMEIPGMLAPFYEAIKKEEIPLIASFTIFSAVYFVLPTLEKSKFIDVSLNVLEDLTS
ncbi:MAG: hypothetical protein ACFFDI_17250 [Promethearchaeota archaeon]